MARRWWSRLAVAAAGTVTAVAGLGVTAPAQAAHPDNVYYRWDQPVNLTGQKKVAKHLCVEWHFDGTMRFDVKHFSSPYGVQWKNPRLRNSKVTIYAYDRCVSHYYDYRKSKTFYDAEVGGRISGSGKVGCSYNPSLSAGFPWGVSVSTTPSCGRTKTSYHLQGRLEPPHKIHKASYTEKGTVAEWKLVDKTFPPWDGQQKVHYVCFTARANFTIFRSSSSSASGTAAKGANTPFCFNMYDAIS